ncbi:hypothetical protein JYU34_008778 [Plutella xylostella]|uniref:Uncharacterized protein n=1 Tax=Plutella xylostella TaxID=51655 RepID=A0ABQ7QLS4_PLUXY|nr:hypothetical protein JYU34_008778 [Plutella xylostella]
MECDRLCELYDRRGKLLTAAWSPALEPRGRSPNGPPGRHPCRLAPVAGVHSASVAYIVRDRE